MGIGLLQELGRLLLCCGTFHLPLPFPVPPAPAPLSSPPPAGWRCNWPSSCGEHCVPRVPQTRARSRMHVCFASYVIYVISGGDDGQMVDAGGDFWQFFLTVMMHIVLSFFLKNGIRLSAGSRWFEANEPSPLWLPVYLWKPGECYRLLIWIFLV